MTAPRQGLLAALRPGDPLAPLAWLALPLPVWWLLGLANLGYLLAAVPMAVALGRRRAALRLPPGFGWWLLFLLWLLLSTSMLGLQPEGTVAGSAASRAVAVAFRLAEYGSATVMLLWALNLDDRLVPPGRLVRMLAVLLGWTVAGGLLGVVAPTFEITSLTESLLPQGLSSNAYVHALVHPAAAQVQDVIAEGDGRPSAPFPYTNSWGNAMGLLLPWGVAAAAGARTVAGRARWITLLVLATVPVVLSLNRGLWIGIALGLALVLVHLARRGRPGAALGAVLGSVVVLAVLAASPLGNVLEERRSGDAPSDDIRSYSISRAVELASASPVLGYGGTRTQTGSPETIAVGKSPTCHNCGNLPIGTNGQLWFVLVGQGFVGAAFYLLFHVRLLQRCWADRSLLATCGAASMLLALWFCLVYDRTGPTGCLEFLAIGCAVKHLMARSTARATGPVVALRQEVRA